MDVGRRGAGKFAKRVADFKKLDKTLAESKRIRAALQKKEEFKANRNDAKELRIKALELKRAARFLDARTEQPAALYGTVAASVAIFTLALSFDVGIKGDRLFAIILLCVLLVVSVAFLLGVRRHAVAAATSAECTSLAEEYNALAKALEKDASSGPTAGQDRSVLRRWTKKPVPHSSERPSAR
jgi:hypothetical protein